MRRVRPLAIALGWIALYALVSGACWFAFTKGVVLVSEHFLLPLPDLMSPWFLPVFVPWFALGLGIATWLVGVRLAGHSWDELGWRAEGGRVRAVLKGSAVGAAVAVLAVALTIVLGSARLRFAPHWSAYFSAAAPLALGLLVAALAEELAFRGFPLRRLADALGTWPATLLLAIAFGVAHLLNPNASPFGILNVALAGIWLSIAFFSRGGIALGWGLHFGWNLGLALLGAPVSGIRFAPPQAVYQPGPHPWFDGGAFGPEGGMVGTIAIATGVAALLGSRLRAPRLWFAA